MKTGRTTSERSGGHAAGSPVRPCLGVLLAAVLLSAWGCSRNDPAPLRAGRNSDAATPRKASAGPAHDLTKKQGLGVAEKTSDEVPVWTPPPRGFDTRGKVVELLGAGDMKTALALVYNEPPGAVREELLGRFAFTLAKSLPAEAAAIVDKDMAAGAERDEAAISVIHQWALNDLVGAQAWAKTFPEGPLKARALREIAGVTDYLEATLRQRTDG